MITVLFVSPCTMSSCDELYPFTSAEINLFSRLHQKVTKFPAPLNLKTREKFSENSEFCNPIEFVDDETRRLKALETKLSRLESEFIKSQTILRDLDLLIEANKQLSLAIEEPKATVHESELDTEIVDIVDNRDSNVPNVDSTLLSIDLENVQSEINLLESLNSAIHLISSCSIPSVASSDPFLNSLRLLITTDPVRFASLISRAGVLMRKCWDNALVAMDRVLERDLVSLEDYLDDRVYKELRDRVLKPLLAPFTLNISIYAPILEHYIASYTQLRVNSVTFILDHRLNNQFASSKEPDQILHLIERTRLLMVVESREFTNIFGKFNVPDIKKAQLNKILEIVGNLLYQRIDPLCPSLSPFQRAKIAGFIHPLMKSILKDGISDPFGLFLKLLSEKHFPLIEEVIKSIEVSGVNEVYKMCEAQVTSSVNISGKAETKTTYSPSQVFDV